MPAEPNAASAANQTSAYEAREHEGVCLAIRARESRNWKPVIDWLLHNPGDREPVFEYLAAAGLIDGISELRPIVPARPGSVLGDYELGEVIGKGAMGTVYRARNRHIRQEVAVKVVDIRGLPQTELTRARFEANAMTDLDHPNVVKLNAYGETEFELYFAMPLMAAGSLGEWLGGLGPDRLLPPKQAAELVRAVAQGVHHAHQRGLIHRDLKPANILLRKEGQKLTPMIADFGLARPADSTLSAGGGGTPLYMAPEQARGDRRLTTAVDVHALGVILYELLAGRTPFAGGSKESVLRRVIEEPAPALRELRPDVSGDLETICLKCLGKAPEERYPSAQALADALTRYLNGEPPIDDRRGWVWGSVSRALGWQRETLGMGSWRVAFWGAASTLFAMAVMQVAALLGAPLWVSQAAIVYYLLAWLGLMWWFLVAPRDALNPVERASTAMHFGAKFACAAVLPVELWLHDGDPLYALPPFLAVVSLTIFAHGVTYWGRFYLVGLAGFALTAAMPLVPATYWPAIYGLFLGAVQFFGGLHLRRVHRVAAAGRQAIPEASSD